MSYECATRNGTRKDHSEFAASLPAAPSAMSVQALLTTDWEARCYPLGRAYPRGCGAERHRGAPCCHSCKLQWLWLFPILLWLGFSEIGAGGSRRSTENKPLQQTDTRSQRGVVVSDCPTSCLFMLRNLRILGCIRSSMPGKL